MLRGRVVSRSEDKIAKKLFIFHGEGYIEESFTAYSDYLDIQKNLNELEKLENEIKKEPKIEEKKTKIKEKKKKQQEVTEEQTLDKTMKMEVLELKLGPSLLSLIRGDSELLTIVD